MSWTILKYKIAPDLELRSLKGKTMSKGINISLVLYNLIFFNNCLDGTSLKTLTYNGVIPCHSMAGEICPCIG